MTGDYIRICPVCEAENPPDRVRCACGALLSGVDFSLRAAMPAAAPTPEPEPVPVDLGPVCPHADCAMANPPGQERCLYCNRPLADRPEVVPERHAPLPPALDQRFRVKQVFPAIGSEADLMLVEALDGGGEFVAKLYRAGLAPDTELLARLNDGHAAHVVRLVEHGVADGVPYEIMEYCRHGSLRDLLAAGPMPRTKVREVVAELATALAEVHRLAILHRDLKPDNILVRALEPLDLVLTDFGIATLRQATQHFTGAARTIHYAAPEALTGVLDEKADWWSLGMIVLEAASGRHPFDGLNEQVAGHHLATRAIDTAAVFDDDLRKLCRGLLLRDPKPRWGADEVRRWLAGDPTLAAPAEEATASPVAHPYRIGDKECRGAVELALALAAHWETGAKDLRRGSVGRWLEQELNDYDLARRLHDILDLGGSDDRALLHFLLVVAPNQPPVWRGTPLDRANLLAMANKAASGDRVARAWLDSVGQEGALALCAGQGHIALGEFGDQWRDGLQRFRAVWQQAQDAELKWRAEPKSIDGEASTRAVDIDALVYGVASRMTPPRIADLHPHLLLALAYPQYVENLRGELIAAQAELSGLCPWFDVFGQVAELDAMTVLAARLALPMAREDAAEERKRQAGMRLSRQANTEELGRDLAQAHQRLVELARRDRLDPDTASQLADAAQALHEACRDALRFTYLDEIAEGMRARVEATGEQSLGLLTALHTLETARAVNQIWLAPRRLLLAGVILLSLGAALGPWLYVPAGLAAGIAVYWRRGRIGRVEEAARQELLRLRSQAYATLNLISKSTQ
jgi:hypothetical protein